MKTRTGLITIGLMALVISVQAANPPASLVMIPPQINYQGRLMTPANSPYNDATHTIDLSLYPTASGGAKMWSERYAVQSRDGYFSVNLGSGGTPLLPSNVPLWQVLWKTDGSSPDNFFMALTVRTDQNGNALSGPVEATPRQQFMTAPFAYRAHQSVYATRADGLFSAPQGVETPSLSSSTKEIGVEVPLRVSGSGSVFANEVRAHGNSPSLKLLASGGPLYVGVDYSLLGPRDVASTINIGAQPSSSTFFGVVKGTDINVGGRTVDVSTPALTINNKPMFVRKRVDVDVSTSFPYVNVAHGISVSDYDVVVVGWLYSQSSPIIRGINQPPSSPNATVSFSARPSVSSSIILDFLGIRKGLTDIR